MILARQTVFQAVVGLLAGALAGAAWANQVADKPATLANPAAVFCEDSGGKFVTHDTDAGVEGLCQLADAWEYFRANSKGE